jgi:hypothetical protein
MTLIVSANGWEYKGWLTEFYPPDLPADWRLDYYQSHFDAVWVPASTWGVVSLSGLESWSEEVSEHFSFYVEALNASEADWLGRLTGLAGSLGGVVYSCVAIQDFSAVLSSPVEVFHGQGFVFFKVYEDCSVKEVGLFFQRLVDNYPEQTRVIVFMDVSLGKLQQFKRLSELFS